MKNIILNFIRYIVSPLLLLIVFLNYRLIFDPDKELYFILTEEHYPKWKLDFLLWEGADITSNEGAPFGAMIGYKHYSLIEEFVEKVPENKRKMMYELTIKYQLPDKIDKRLRKALKIDEDPTVSHSSMTNPDN